VHVSGDREQWWRAYAEFDADRAKSSSSSPGIERLSDLDTPRELQGRRMTLPKNFRVAAQRALGRW
jgi:hypothetical protein